MHTLIRICMKVILGNQAYAGQQPVCAWFKKLKISLARFIEI